MSISNRTVRVALRTIHLVSAGFMGTYLYSPWSTISWFSVFIEWIVFPIGFVVTGLWLWQMPRVTKWLNR